MQYVVFLWEKWDREEDMQTDQLARHQEFGQAAAEAGVLRGGSGLHPVSASTTIRLRDDEVLMTDGPYVESKEQISGYYLLECADLDEAIAWAARIPVTRLGAVEVRPVLAMT
jgi:hypothetical protein